MKRYCQHLLCTENQRKPHSAEVSSPAQVILLSYWSVPADTTWLSRESAKGEGFYSGVPLTPGAPVWTLIPDSVNLWLWVDVMWMLLRNILPCFHEVTSFIPSREELSRLSLLQGFPGPLCRPASETRPFDWHYFPFYFKCGFFLTLLIAVCFVLKLKLDLVTLAVVTHSFHTLALCPQDAQW